MDNRFTLTLEHKQKLSPSVELLRFSLAEPFSFRPGQWITLYIPSFSPDPSLSPHAEPLRRDYSIAGAPTKETLELAVTRVPNGPGSNRLLALSLGTTLDARGPAGFFTRDAEAPSLYIATGTGVAPIRAMLQSAGQHDATLLFGCRTRDDILFADDWAKLPHLQFLPSLSRAGAGWSGLRGHVQDHLGSLLRQDQHINICGLRPMVDDVRRILKTVHGVTRERIHSERFD